MRSLPWYGLILDQGFDEFMNLVLDDAEEVDVKKKSRRALGKAAQRRVPSVFTVRRHISHAICFKLFSIFESLYLWLCS